MSATIKHFYMLRHGQSEANASKIYSGHMDTPLTEEGKSSADFVAELVPSLAIKPTIVIHSHLQRARETARPVANALGLDMMENPDWAEQNYGDWQGRPHDEVRHLREAGIDPPNGERNEDFMRRIQRAYTETMAEYDLPLVVAHGGAFKGIAHNFGGKIYDSRNCILHEFIPNDGNDVFPWNVFIYESATQKQELKSFDEMD